MTGAPGLSPEDRSELAERGLTAVDAQRQLDLLRGPRKWRKLVRPCTGADGVVRLDAGEIERSHAAHAEAAAAGRFHKFVPASGAASRMFKSLVQADAADLATFLREIEKFAFHRDLDARIAAGGEQLSELVREGRHAPVLDALLADGGLGYERLPKGLLLFHHDAAGPRTPLEEHLVEAADHVRDADGVCRLHFTVSPEHRARFEKHLAEVGPVYESRFGVRFRVGWSAQKAATDTIALDGDGRPARGRDGRLVLRPGGHGALIENLDDLGADLVYIKNIDNVQPDHAKEATLGWKRALGGLLVRTEQAIHAMIGRLQEPRPASGVLDEAAELIRGALHDPTPVAPASDGPEKRRGALLRRLRRPLRVCGVVPNTGEPGGGPFWVRGPDGHATPQIVETSEVDRTDPAQAEILSGATHFNPVDLVCAVRDVDGRAFDLHEFVDPGASIVTSKTDRGVEMKVLERPGLWNGGMAGWNTVFVEVPLETFSPVKSVLDLLRPEHQ